MNVRENVLNMYKKCIEDVRISDPCQNPQGTLDADG